VKNGDNIESIYSSLQTVQRASYLH